MKPTAFVETTIPSFHHETRSNSALVLARAATRRWWDSYRSEFRPCTSPGVLVEIGRTPEPERALMREMLRDIDILPVPEGLMALADYSIEQRLMPRDALGDAQHMAFASLTKSDFLLTWNCRHLANQNKVNHLTTLNRRWGLGAPVLATPSTLIPEHLS